MSSSQFKAPILNFNNNLWGYHFPVPEDIARNFIDGTNRRVICTIEGSIKIHSALMGSKTGWFILLNKKLVQELKHIPEISVVLEKDHSEFGMEMPEELEVLLDQDEVGKSLFMSLTPGKQRNLIYIVSKVKNTNSRLNKALAIVHHLKKVNGALDFKMLNETIKYYNNLGKLH